MSRFLIISGLALALGGCAAQGVADAPKATPSPVAAPARSADLPVGSFSDWRSAFRGRALAAGVRPATFDRAFAGVTPNEKIVELDRYQPEFTRPIWEYLDSAVSDSRVSTGRQKLASESRFLM